MKSLAPVVFALCFLTAEVALAKRAPPAEVAPVRAGGIEYRVPHGQMGCVEAWDVKENELLWRRQIYVVRFSPELERDVQDVYILSIEPKDRTLVVRNERKSEYHLDLDSLQVKVVQGNLVEHRK